jgi:cathepsin L
MRFLITLLVAAIAFATALSVPDYTGYTYEQFLSEHRSGSKNSAPCPYRKAVFEANLAKIKAHNAQGRSWYMAVNEHADMTEEEFLSFYTLKRDARVPAPHRLQRRSAFGSLFRPAVPAGDAEGIPSRVDWSDSIDKALSQGSCGSCWAFGTAHTLMGRAYIETRKRVSVSTQQITSCTPNPLHCGGEGGCKGATFQLAAEYIVNATFVTTEEAYPYISGRTEETGDCLFSAERMPPSVSLKGYVTLPRNDKAALLKELVNGPVAVSVAASTWYLYGGGVFDGCSSQGDGVVNHLVTAVGYDVKVGYIQILNSWGSSWGEKGGMRLKLHATEPVILDTLPLNGTRCEYEGSAPEDVVGECGIFYDSAYPTGLKVLS